MDDLVGLDGTYQFLSRKDRIHDRNVGCGEIGRDGKDQDAGISRARCLVHQASGWWMSQTIDDYTHIIRVVREKIEGSLQHSAFVKAPTKPTGAERNVKKEN
jgi:hypothetical protein